MDTTRPGGTPRDEKPAPTTDRKVVRLAATTPDPVLKSPSEAFAEALLIAERADRRDSPWRGLSTGLLNLDALLDGLMAPDLIVLAGQPLMGKSTLALNIAYNVASAYRPGRGPAGQPIALDGGKVLFFSLEASAAQLATRLVTLASGFPLGMGRFGLIRGDVAEPFIRVAEDVLDAALHIDDEAGLTVTDLRQRARHVIQRMYGLDIYKLKDGNLAKCWRVYHLSTGRISWEGLSRLIRQIEAAEV